VNPEQLAERFHETYERLAPDFGYETRRDSARPWAEVPEQNRALMIAVCAEILTWWGEAKDHRRWVCREIASDARRDVHDFEGRPFTGRTVAEYMGLQAALIAALAKVVESLLPAESSAERPPER
jgi:hypothetical protein